MAAKAMVRGNRDTSARVSWYMRRAPRHADRSRTTLEGPATLNARARRTSCRPVCRRRPPSLLLPTPGAARRPSSPSYTTMGTASFIHFPPPTPHPELTSGSAPAARLWRRRPLLPQPWGSGPCPRHVRTAPVSIRAVADAWRAQPQPAGGGDAAGANERMQLARARVVAREARVQFAYGVPRVGCRGWGPHGL